MSKRIIYISGRISGIDLQTAQENFKFSAKEVAKFHGADKVVNPFDIKPFLGVKKWSCYMIADLWQLRKCTHIAMRPDWKRSRGACIEHYFASFIFKQHVIYLN